MNAKYEHLLGKRVKVWFIDKLTFTGILKHGGKILPYIVVDEEAPKGKLESVQFHPAHVKKIVEVK